MKNMPPAAVLPPTECPPIADAKGCEAWLARAALTDPRKACHEFTLLLESLEETPPRDSDYLDILERLREPIAIAQNEHGKKFAIRPLPLKDYEQAAFHQVVDLWTTLGRAYRRLLESMVDDRPAHLRPALQGKEALLAQRALDCVVDLMLAHYRCRRELDGELWADLHHLYRIAEARGIATETVPAGRKLKAISTPAEVYNRALLLALANPYALTARELNWLRRWTTIWAFKAELRIEADAASGYAVDTAGRAGPDWVQDRTAPSATRFIGTTALRRSVAGRIRKLEAGADPQSLGLGKDCVQPECGRLLLTLLRAWTEPPSTRAYTRRLAPGRTELVSGLAAIHLAIGGKALKSQARHWDYSRRDAEQLFIYHGVAASTATEQAGFTAEKWETLDESASGLRLRRRGPGDRLYHQQLVALKPEGARAFILCDVRWLILGFDDSLTIGAQTLPGLADAAGVRPAAQPGQPPDAYTQGFVLPATAAGPAAIVLPAGWFQAGRELDLQHEAQTVRIRIGAHLRRGYDFDLAGFERVG